MMFDLSVPGTGYCTGKQVAGPARGVVVLEFERHQLTVEKVVPGCLLDIFQGLPWCEVVV